MKLKHVFLLALLLTLVLPVIPFFVPQAQAVFGAEDIILEYGAESGVLQPPWDLISEEAGYSDVSVSSDVARTGNKSIKLATLQDDVYPLPTYPYTGCSYREYNLPEEFYLSWWIYLPTNYYTHMIDSDAGDGDPKGYDTIGGFKYQEGSSYEWKFRFRIGHSTASGFYLRFALEGRDYPYSVEEAKNYTEPTVTTWHHLQIYWKESAVGNGIIRAWYDNYLMFEKVGSGDWYNDPQYHDASAPDLPRTSISRYTSNYDPAGYTYTDDTVIATEKVTETCY